MEDKLRKPFQDNFLKALSNLLIYNTGTCNSLYSYNYSFKKKNILAHSLPQAYHSHYYT